APTKTFTLSLHDALPIFQVRRVEHQFDADQHDDRVAPRQGTGQTDAEEQSRKQEICGKRSHGCAKRQTPKPKLQKNAKRETSKRRMNTRVGIWCLVFLWCLTFGIWCFISLLSSR